MRTSRLKRLELLALFLLVVAVPASLFGQQTYPPDGPTIQPIACMTTISRSVSSFGANIRWTA